MAAALGSAHQLHAAAPPALRKRGKKTLKASRALPVLRAASTEPKIESVAAAVPSDAFLPDGLYCVDNTQTIRRKTRCVFRRVIAAARRGPRRDSTALLHGQTSGSRYSLYVIRFKRRVAVLTAPSPPDSHPQDRQHRQGQDGLRPPHRPPDDDHLRHARRRGHRRRGARTSRSSL